MPTASPSRPPRPRHRARSRAAASMPRDRMPRERSSSPARSSCSPPPSPRFRSRCAGSCSTGASWPTPRSSHCPALGYGSLYNHGNPANMRYEGDDEAKVLRFVAIRAIAAGEGADRELQRRRRRSRVGRERLVRAHVAKPATPTGRRQPLLTPALLSSPLRAAITAATRPPEPALLAGAARAGAAGSSRRSRRARARAARRPRRARADARVGPSRPGAGPAAGVRPQLERGRGADVPGRSAAAHSRRRHPRRADPRQDLERRLALAPRPEPVAVRQRRDLGAACSPAGWWRRTATSASARPLRRVVGAAASR